VFSNDELLHLRLSFILICVCVFMQLAHVAQSAISVDNCFSFQALFLKLAYTVDFDLIKTIKASCVDNILAKGIIVPASASSFPLRGLHCAVEIVTSLGLRSD